LQDDGTNNEAMIVDNYEYERQNILVAFVGIFEPNLSCTAGLTPSSPKSAFGGRFFILPYNFLTYRTDNIESKYVNTFVTKCFGVNISTATEGKATGWNIL
jgi:hypothetical protein